MATAARERLQPIFALLSGTLFGLGLAVSGMIDPAKVLAFLDVAGAWDPTLAFVMLGALCVTTPAFHYVLKRRRPWFADAFALPTKADLDPRLITGATLFGIGWGLSGFCPGPAVTSLPLLAKGTLVFVPAMLIGIGLARLLVQGRSSGKALSAGTSKA